MKALLPPMLLFLFTFVSCHRPIQEPDVYLIPHVRNLSLDGDLHDWEDLGMEFPLLVSTKGMVDPDDFSARVKIAWNEEGLWLACRIRDDFLELSGRKILENDALELFVSEEVGSQRMAQYVSPSGPIGEEEVRRLDKNGPDSGGPVRGAEEFRMISQLQEDGLTFEIQLVSGKPMLSGPNAGLQLILHDADPGEKGSQSYSWHYSAASYFNPWALQQIRLVEGGREAPRKTPFHFSASRDENNTFRFKIAGDDGIHIHEKEHMEQAAQGEHIEISLDDSEMVPVDPGLVDFRHSSTPENRSERFEKEIRIIEYRLSKDPPSPNSTLFLGSSSIRLWRSAKLDFAEHEVRVAGFGGSRTADLNYYFNRLIRPWSMDQIVYFCGINDINGGVDPDTILSNVEEFIHRAREVQPHIRILLLSNTVSVGKRANFEKIVDLNKAYIQLAEMYPYVQYVDVHTPMLDARGNIRPELFSTDFTHMNATGYSLWKDVLSESLKEQN